MKLITHLPGTLVIVLSSMAICAGLTWIIPAGEFDRKDKNGIEGVVFGSYHETESAHQRVFAFFEWK